MEEIKAVHFADYFFDVIFGLAILFVYCQLGANVTDCCFKVSDILYQSQWYRLALTDQKHYVLMIENMQTTLEFDALYVIPLTMRTFAKVCFIYNTTPFIC